MKKPTISVLCPTGTDLSDTVKAILAQSHLTERFHVVVSPLRLDETEFGVDPWSEVRCPVCERQEFATVNPSLVYCEHCKTEFRVRPTAGDPGYCVDATTEHTDVERAVHPALVGMEMFLIAKTGEDDREWLVREKNGGIVSRDLFLRTPTFGETTHLVKME